MATRHTATVKRHRTNEPMFRFGKHRDDVKVAGLDYRAA